MKPYFLVPIFIVSFALSGCNKQKANSPALNPLLKTPSSQDSQPGVQIKPASDPQKNQKIIEVRNTLRLLLEAIEEKDQAKINRLTTAYGRESLSRMAFDSHDGYRLRTWNEVANGQTKAKWKVEGENSVSVTNERVGLLIFIKKPHWKLKTYALRFD